MSRNRPVEELSEDKQIRTVKLHFHRFGRFLRYLKQQGAVIELTVPGENGAESHKQVYTAGKRDGNPSIEDLVAEALNISGSLAREYTSRKLGIDDKHSDGDKIYATGKVIDAVTFYLGGDPGVNGPGEKAGDLLSASSPFAFRRRIFLGTETEYRKQFEAMDLFEGREPLLSGPFREAPKLVAAMLQLLPRYLIEFRKPMYNDFPFNEAIGELAGVFGESLKPRWGEPVNELIRTMKRIEWHYEGFDQKAGREDQLLPGYIDYLVPYHREHALASARLRFGGSGVAEKSGDLPLEEAIAYRYEILWSLVDSGRPVSEWGLQQHALLMLALAEFMAADSLVDRCLRHILNELRFSVYYSDDQQTLNLQQDGLTLAELIELLSRYNFRRGIENTVEIQHTNLINERILKYPEPHAVKVGYLSRQIESCVTRKLKDHFRERIREDLNVPYGFGLG